ncbi:alpha-methylacyl-CoA racemase [Rhizoclosmatium globosum]|uniref:Alpha-methylacyl-CoA racemase n=1 Tax=Rhizoclosmatium globosum TaxID=329046 RepID=A0A1Y2CIG3_9FUNG|nr:alpha-methylacyl-CoA racemase [Rhizoclosmatium globosum]|eukprot:ORY46841.1 alpha-methylacyl-CoA racemase [Rhizoclosmatium globosum]
MAPLSHIKVIEFAGLAPVPFAGMMLADWGANVIRIDRVGGGGIDVLSRGKKSIAINLRSPQGVQLALRLIRSSRILKLGPDEIFAINPRCIVARLTGYGQTGAYSKLAGHDINYIAVAGALAGLGRAGENPTPPANILGDFAGGGMFCVVGILMALLEREKSGKGQVVDAAMIDGAAYLSTFEVKMKQAGLWNAPRGQNMLDSGAPFYDTYKTKDGKYVSVGAIEPQFYKLLLRGLNLPVEEYASKQLDTDEWGSTKQLFSDIFQSKTRKEWETIFEGTDACVAPVLEWDEVLESRHFKDRCGEGFKFDDWNPAVAPRLSRTPALDVNGRKGPEVGEHSVEVLARNGLSPQGIEALVNGGIVYTHKDKSRL